MKNDCLPILEATNKRVATRAGRMYVSIRKRLQTHTHANMANEQEPLCMHVVAQNALCTDTMGSRLTIEWLSCGSKGRHAA